ncbi:HNH endonuclease [Rhizobium sp. Nf11,1]|uniref:HNH endonuclease n=1 Tax=Rhizobium sp. Nf11,1 TaxID=3404923 RepID=UPI003D327227
MPITKGAGNPDWTWDETLLALDLFYRHGGPIDRNHADVHALSAALRAAVIFPKDGRKDNFRNPDGVSLKLQNLQSAIDPSRGLSSSKRDREVVAEFPHSRREELARIAAAILHLISNEVQPLELPDDEVFIEGQLITASHRRRDSRIRRKLLEKSGDKLVCQICDFSPPTLARPLQESFFDAHHIVPLSNALGDVRTRLADVVLLCAGCHKFVHKLIASQKRWVSIPEARSVFSIKDGPIRSSLTGG